VNIVNLAKLKKHGPAKLVMHLITWDFLVVEKPKVILQKQIVSEEKIMSRMSDIDIEIVELLEEGLKPTSIAGLLRIPLEMVYDAVSAYDESLDENGYDESMDGDHDSAMTSAGFGTDEDYGYYGDE